MRVPYHGGNRVGRDRYWSIDMPSIPQIQDKLIVYTFRLSHDPTYEYKYVGQTARGLSRLQEHINEAKNPSHPRYHSKKSIWIRENYFAITFEILEVCDSLDQLNACEVKWIYVLKERGHVLLNETSGGAGTRGFSPSWSDETKAKISSSKMGHVVSEETRQKLSLAQSGKSLTSATKQKILDTKTANGTLNHSDETRAKMSIAHKLRFERNGHAGHSQEIRDKLSTTRRAMEIDNSKSLHIRWHEKRSKPSPTCKHCTTTKH